MYVRWDVYSLVRMHTRGLLVSWQWVPKMGVHVMWEWPCKVTNGHLRWKCPCEVRMATGGEKWPCEAKMYMQGEKLPYKPPSEILHSLIFFILKEMELKHVWRRQNWETLLYLQEFKNCEQGWLVESTSTLNSGDNMISTICFWKVENSTFNSQYYEYHKFSINKNLI